MTESESNGLTDLQFSLLGSLTTVRLGEAKEETIKGSWGFHRSTINSLWRRDMLDYHTTASGRVWSITKAGKKAIGYTR